MGQKLDVYEVSHVMHDVEMCLRPRGFSNRCEAFRLPWPLSPHLLMAGVVGPQHKRLCILLVCFDCRTYSLVVMRGTRHLDIGLSQLEKLAMRSSLDLSNTRLERYC